LGLIILNSAVFPLVDTSASGGFLGSEIQPQWVAVIVGAVLFVIFIMVVIAVIYNNCKTGGNRRYNYDAEEATRMHGADELEHETVLNASLHKPERSLSPGNHNQYGFFPQDGSRSNVAEVLSYENPWPVSTEEFEPPRTTL
jgi:hypothetical protein